MPITPLSPPPFIAQSPATPAKKQPDARPHVSPPLRNPAPSEPANREPLSAPSGAEPSAEAQEKIDRISTLLERSHLIQMMSTPNARGTREDLKEIRELLSEDSLRTLTSDSVELMKLKRDIGQGLSEKNLRNLQREAAVGPNPEQFHHHLSNTDHDVPWRGALQMRAEQRKEDHRINQRSRLCESLCQRLIAIGQPYRPPEPETTPDQRAGTDDKKPENTHGVRPKTAPQVQTVHRERAPGEINPTLKRIDELLSRQSLVNILRAPDSAQSVQSIEELTGLLSEASLNAWNQDTRVQERLKDRVRQVISRENLDTLRREENIAVEPQLQAGAAS
ncbi:hypothetical protein [Pseudomonas tolaasii]|uniref:hypothetical protein n=1 Tax=Pseudomonas tolaasii TaxID=29442 RepID=UPI00214B9A0D|nr:hypothetical protein [Pseudomonas tolaasii]